MMPKQRRPLRILLVLAALAVVCFGVVSIFNAVRYSGMGKLTTLVAPSEVTLTLNTKIVKINRLIYLTPGTYKWEAIFKDFQTKRGSFTIKKGESKELNVYLQPANNAALEWLKSHPNESSAIEAGVSKRYDELANEATEETPFIQDLPFIAPGYTFRIDYGSSTVDGKPKTTIYISYINESAKADALEWIRSEGYDPSTLTIEYSKMESQQNSAGGQWED